MDATGRPEAEMVLRLSGITKRFGPLVANDAISLSLKRGEVVALLGENGAGKTTLMNILFGHYTADEGEIEVFGKTLPPGDPHAALAAGIGMVHQHFTLADQMTVLENIVLGTRPLWSFNLGKSAAREKIRRLALDYGLEVDPDRMITELSVGERQRVEILKALYREARILILDEPTAVLTPMETEALFATLAKLVAAGLSVIFISHKLGEVQAVSDRVVVLRGGKLAGERKTAEATRRELAELMVGGQLPVNEIGPASRQIACSNSAAFPREAWAARRSSRFPCSCAVARSPASRAFPAMARLHWRRLFREPWKPWRATSSFTAKKSRHGRLALLWSVVWVGYRKTGMQPA
jgi:ABC-type uncharacterized transport system ATPase subunit